jgi:hypothetical protein
MSSPKGAAAKNRRPTARTKPAPGAKPAAKPRVKAAKPASAKAGSSGAVAANGNGLSADAIRLADEIESAFASRDDAISVEAMQALMGALCRVYSAQVENGAKFTPIAEGQVVSPTGVMVTASGLLRAANLAVFELGMWQSWTGR